MKILAIALLTTAAFAQVPCPSSEKLKLPPDATASSPAVCVDTSLPPTKATIVVNGALPALQCGNTYSIKPGHYPSTTLPKCAAGNWIILKAAADSSAAGSRFVKSSGVVFDHIIAPGYNRIGPGIEVKQKVAGGFDSTLLDARNSSHVVLLRSHLAGTPTGEVAHAVYAIGSDHLAVVGNKIDTIHCISGGKCGDSQAVLIGCGAGGAGFLIENNYLEAAGENFMSGGCAQSGYVSDVIVERNHMFKPLSWMVGDPSYGGIRFLVKNSLELKSCVRCLIQYNDLENSWGGFSQNGYTVLFTVKTQNLPGVLASLQDVTFRYNRMLGGAGFQIAAARSDPPASISSLGIQNLSIHDNLVLIDPKFSVSSGIGIQLTLQDQAAQMTGVVISNNSFWGISKAALLLGSRKAGTLVFNSNILEAGQYNATGTGSPSGDCSQGGNTKAAQMLTACWTSLTFNSNYVVGGNSSWPSGTSTPTLSPFVSVTGGDWHSTVLGLGANLDAITPNLVP